MDGLAIAWWADLFNQVDISLSRICTRMRLKCVPKVESMQEHAPCHPAI